MTIKIFYKSYYEFVLRGKDKRENYLLKKGKRVFFSSTWGIFANFLLTANFQEPIFGTALIWTNIMFSTDRKDYKDQENIHVVLLVEYLDVFHLFLMIRIKIIHF